MTDARGRADRQTEVRQQRRRRDDATLDAGQAKKLAIPEEVEKKLKAEGRVPRWINDEGNRIHNLTKRDDYDKVEGVEPVPVGTGQDGKPVLAHLYSKPAEFIAEDRARKDAARREMEKGMLEGHVPDSKNPDAQRVTLPPNTYADRANKIERGNQIL